MVSVCSLIAVIVRHYSQVDKRLILWYTVFIKQTLTPTYATALFHARYF